MDFPWRIIPEIRWTSNVWRMESKTLELLRIYDNVYMNDYSSISYSAIQYLSEVSWRLFHDPYILPARKLLFWRNNWLPNVRCNSLHFFYCALENPRSLDLCVGRQIWISAVGFCVIICTLLPKTMIITSRVFFHKTMMQQAFTPPRRWKHTHNLFIISSYFAVQDFAPA